MMDLSWVREVYEAGFTDILCSKGLPEREAVAVAANLADPESLRPYLLAIDVKDKKAVVSAIGRWADERLDAEPFVYWYPMSLEWL
ncbi:MAG TPA: hypothetical protein VJ816_11405 [Gemmatimonadales bacterium]|nr:hypothetical protein [Gemmatimonadales bacterium]